MAIYTFLIISLIDDDETDNMKAVFVLLLLFIFGYKRIWIEAEGIWHLLILLGYPKFMREGVLFSFYSAHFLPPMQDK